jgi:ATP-binding cassette subfamily B protein
MKAYLVRIWNHISNKQKRHLAFLALLMLISASAEIFSLGLVVPFLAVITQPEKVALQGPFATFFRDAGISQGPSARISITMFFVFGVVTSGFIRVTLLWAQTRLGNAIGSDLGAAAYEKTLYQPYLKHTQGNSSNIIATLQTKVNTMVYFVVIPVLNLVTSICIALAILMAAAWIEPVATISIGLFFVGIYLVIGGFSRKRIHRNSNVVKQNQSVVVQKIMEGLGAIRDVLLDGSQVQYVRDYRFADTRLRRSYGNLAILAGLPKHILESVGIVLLAGTACFLIGKNPNSSNALGVVGVIGLTAQRVLPLIQQVYSSWVSMNGGVGCLRDVLELLDQPMPDGKSHAAKNKFDFKNEISFQNISFRYSDNMPWVLDKLSFTVPKGSRVGFIGKTGSGKSTCLDLLMGLLEPTAGQILVDGYPLSQKTIRAWQGNIAHVPQAIYLADISLAENIAFGTPRDKIDIERVRSAARKAHIADFIESLPQGYQGLVGERGIRLSGGQRQRIGIARALYKTAQIIIFDEATSALDNETEQVVMQTIESLSADLTVFIIAHRLTTLKNCTKIINLDLNNAEISHNGPFHTQSI